MSNRVRRAAAALAVSALCAVALTACQGLLVQDVYTYGQLEVRAQLRSGAGVPGVRITVYSGTRIQGTGVTGSDGTARFNLLPGGPLGVLALPPDGFRHRDLVNGYIRGIPMEEGKQEVLTFPLYQTAPGDLRVEIRDSSGTALDSVRVELFAPSGVVQRYTTGIEFPAVHTFRALPFGDYGVRVMGGRGYRLPGAAPSLTRDGLLVDGSMTEQAVLSVAPCRGTVGGRVEWWNGQPLTGATVVVYDGEAVRLRAITGADGRVDAKGAACGNYGIFVATLPADAVPFTAGEEIRDGLRIANHNGTASTSFRVSRCTATLRVSVRDQFGNAVQGAPLELYTGRGVIGRDTTDATGIATPRVSPTPCDQAGVRVQPFRYYLPDASAAAAYTDGLVLRNEATVPVSLRLRRCRGGIASTVRRSDGRPVAGVTLRVYTGSGESRRGNTGADGRYIVDDLLCGDYGVSVATLPPGTLPMAPNTTWRDGLRFSDDGRSFTADFTVDQCLGSYRVTVRDQNGAPVSAAPVELYDGTGGILQRVTDANGLAIIEVPPRTCRTLGVRVSPAPGTITEPGAGAQYIDGLEPRNDSVTSLSLRLRRTTP